MEREEDLSEDLEDLDLKRALAFSRMAIVVDRSVGGGGGGEDQCVADCVRSEVDCNPVEG